MSEDRSASLKILLLMARFSILAGIVVAITGAAAVVAEGLETGIWEPAWAFGWIALGALPYLGGSMTGRALRGPGSEGLAAVGLVTTLFGLVAVAIWVMEGLARR